MTVTEQLAVNETVQEVLYMMQAIRNGWIYEERKKPQPNTADIATWQAEIAAFADEEFSLSDPSRRADIQARALNVYAPIIKARMQSKNMTK